MKILVTGGAGFIGSHLVDAYLDDGHEVCVVDDFSTGHETNLNPKAEVFRCDLAHGDLYRILETFKPEVVSHHAAQASVAVSVKDPVFDAKVNVQGTIRLLEASVKAGVRKVIFASSGGTVYGFADSLPVNETAPLRALSPYGITKIAGEHYLDFYSHEHGLDYTIFRYGNVYGPRQDPHGEAGVVAIFCERLLKGQEAVIFATEKAGDPGCVRDYVYVGDIVRANVTALTHGDGERLNIGTGRETTTLDIYRAIADALGMSDKEPEFGDPRPGDLLRITLDAGRAKERMGWEAEWRLEKGIEETADYYRKKSG